MFNIFQIFCAIFFAQWVLGTQRTCLSDAYDKNFYQCLHELYREELWLTIETICFYIYMFSVMIFLFKHSMQEIIFPKEVTNFKK